VRRTPSPSLADKEETLLTQEKGVAREIARLRREEEYLGLQVRQAREQVRYYEGLLELLRRDWGKVPALEELVRRLS
jgi:hypothetical protein